MVTNAPVWRQAAKKYQSDPVYIALRAVVANLFDEDNQQSAHDLASVRRVALLIWDDDPDVGMALISDGYAQHNERKEFGGQGRLSTTGGPGHGAT